MQVTEKIAAFRARMKDENFAAVIVPTADSHASEYIADHFKTRQWLSGFTGSAGTLVVGEKEAARFVDGRYFIQAEQQIAGSGITLMRMGTAGTPTLEEYLAGLLRENDALGVDFGVVSEKFAEDMRAAVAGSGALRRRLLEMGLTPGAAVMLRKRAPLGDPLELSLRGYELSLRTADAQYIEVEVGRTC